MANQVVVELSAKDAEMVAAWQRAKDNISEFEQKIKSSKEHSHSWGEEFAGDLKKWGEGLAGTYLGFEGVKKGVEFVVDAYKEEGQALKEVVDEQRKSREELTQILALAGKLKEAPAVAEGLEKIPGATRAEKSAIFKAAAEAAPDLSTEQDLALTKQTAALSGVFGQQGAADTTRLAAKLQQSDPTRSARDAANMAIAARGEARERAGELSDPGAMRAFEVLHGKAGMSSERALAFETEALRHHLQTRGLEKITDALTEQKTANELRHVKGPEDAAYNRFYRERDAQKRLALLEHDAGTRHAVLGEKEAEHLGQMSERSIAEREGRIVAAQRGAGAGAGLLQQFTKVEPLDADRRRAEIANEELKEGRAKRDHEDEFLTRQKRVQVELEELHPGMGPIGRAFVGVKQGVDSAMHRIGIDSAGFKASVRRREEEVGAEPVDKAAPSAAPHDLVGELRRGRAGRDDPHDLVSELHRQRAGRDAPADLVTDLRRHRDEDAPHDLVGELRGRHAGGDAPHDLVSELRRHTQLLEHIAAKTQTVAVNVHNGGGGSSPRVNATERPEPSWSTALGANH